MDIYTDDFTELVRADGSYALVLPEAEADLVELFCDDVIACMGAGLRLVTELHAERPLTINLLEPRNRQIRMSEVSKRLSNDAGSRAALNAVRQLFSMMSAFLGGDLHKALSVGEAESGTGARDAVNALLVAIQRALDDLEPDQAHRPIHEITSAFRALSAGETMPILAPGTRLIRLRAAYTISRIRLEAFACRQLLRATKLSASEADQLFEESFTQRWDTARKWRDAVIESGVLTPGEIEDIEQAVRDELGPPNERCRRRVAQRLVKLKMEFNAARLG